MEGISVFWHICGINYWREIAEDQIKTMESSGLLDRTDRVMVTYLGADRNDVAWLERRSKKIEVNTAPISGTTKGCASTDSKNGPSPTTAPSSTSTPRASPESEKGETSGAGGRCSSTSPSKTTRDA